MENKLIWTVSHPSNGVILRQIINCIRKTRTIKLLKVNTGECLCNLVGGKIS